jgi:hypothetical protein
MTKSDCEKNSIALPGAVAMGTGVMIGASNFALTGQIAEHAGPLFPLPFVVGAAVTAFSAHTQQAAEKGFWTTSPIELNHGCYGRHSSAQRESHRTGQFVVMGVA